MSLENLFNPKSIAIVGASEEEGKVGNVIAKNILNLGYAGEVFLVNPKYDQLFGKKCYRNLSDIESDVDLAIIAIPAKFVADEIQKNADKIKNYVIISAGFSEIGSEGRAREEIIQKIAAEKELNILGPNCLGFIIPSLKLNASFAGGMPENGNIAFISQSGALAVGIMDIAEKEDICFSNIISIGNKMDMDEAKILDYLAKDDNTKVIGMYLEGIKDGKKFIEIASRVSKIKPVVVLKAGKTEKAQKAIASHTGALAGSDEIISAVFKKCGIIRADNLEEFFDFLNIAALTEPPKNKSVAVITNAGGPGVLATDAFFKRELFLADIEEKIKNIFRKFLPQEAALSNPVDLLGDAQEDRYDKTLKVIGKNISIGSIICVLTPQDQTPVAKIARKIISFRKKTDKNITAVFIGGGRVQKAVKKMKETGIPNFRYPDQAISALDSYCKWDDFCRKHLQNGEEVNLYTKNLDNSLKNDQSRQNNEETASNSERKNKAIEIIKKAKSEGRQALYFSEAKDIMEMYGIKSPVTIDINPGENIPEETNYPVALKVDSDKVLHKTDKKALILNIKNREELEKAVSEIRINFPKERLIVQPMLERKTELILGIKKDPIFGPVVVYGLGGIYTEIFKMVDFLIPPADISEIKNNLYGGKIGFLFGETRGQKVYNIDEIAKIIFGMSQFALENEEISELDINPLLIYNDGSAAFAVDIKIIF